MEKLKQYKMLGYGAAAGLFLFSTPYLKRKAEDFLCACKYAAYRWRVHEEEEHKFAKMQEANAKEKAELRQEWESVYADQKEEIGDLKRDNAELRKNMAALTEQVAALTGVVKKLTQQNTEYGLPNNK